MRYRQPARRPADRRRPVIGAQQIVARQRQQVGCLVPLLSPPRVEVPRGDHFGGDPVVVEREDLVVTDEQIAATGPLLQLLEFARSRALSRKK